MKREGYFLDARASKEISAIYSKYESTNRYLINFSEPYGCDTEDENYNLENENPGYSFIISNKYQSLFLEPSEKYFNQSGIYFEKIFILVKDREKDNKEQSIEEILKFSEHSPILFPSDRSYLLILETHFGEIKPPGFKDFIQIIDRRRFLNEQRKKNISYSRKEISPGKYLSYFKTPGILNPGRKLYEYYFLKKKHGVSFFFTFPESESEIEKDVEKFTQTLKFKQ